MKKLFFKILALVNCMVPKKDMLVLHAYPDVEDQVVAILRYLKKTGFDGRKVVLLVSKNPEDAKWALRQLVGDYADHIRVLRKNRLAGIWSYLRARNVMVTHGIYGFEKVPKKQCLINLWHGMPIKTIWSGMGEVPQCTYLLSTSPLFSDILQKASSLPSEKIRITGLPRNDLLLYPGEKAKEFGDEMRSNADRIVFFLPTYRKSREGFMTVDGEDSSSALAMDEKGLGMLKELAQRLRLKILVKPHPMSSHYGKVEQIDDRILLITDKWLHERGVSLYEALSQSDMLISDTSSVYIDYLILDRPALCYFPDLAAYRDTRRFLLEPVEEWFVEPVCEDVLDLCGQIEKVFSGDENGGKRSEIQGALNPKENHPSVPHVFALTEGLFGTKNSDSSRKSSNLN